MRHLQFKSSQTAAIYVADGLEEAAREEFELHLMDCPECVEDVEISRALKHGIRAAELGAAADRPAAPAPARAPVAAPVAAPAAVSPAPAATGGGLVLPRPPSRSVGSPWHWQIAASAVLAACLGVLGGWFLHGGQGTSIDDDSIALTSLAPLTRGTDCSVVRLAANTRVVALRIPGAEPGVLLRATHLDGSALGRGDYSVRVQADHSWLVRLAGPAIIGHEVALATEAAAGDAGHLPLGCVAAVVAP